MSFEIFVRMWVNEIMGWISVDTYDADKNLKKYTRIMLKYIIENLIRF